MKFRSLRILLVLLVVLVAVALIYTGIQKRPKSSKPFANMEFESIEIKAKDSLCVFKKIDGGWKIVTPIEYPVDTSVFNSFLNGLKNLELGEVISNRPEKYADFEVDESGSPQSGTKVKLCSARDTSSLILGKMAGDFEHWWLRLPPKPDVYLSKGLSKHIIDKGPDEWRDKTILAFNRADLKEIELNGQKIVRVDTLWLKDEKPMETFKTDDLLNLLSSLKADGFSKGEIEPEFTVKLTFELGEKEILFIGKKTDNQYPAKLDGNPTIFLLNSWKVDRLTEIMR